LLNGEERYTTMILASSTSGHTCLNESYHLDSDKEATILENPAGMEMPRKNATIVSTSSALDNFSRWIDLRKKK